MARTLIQISQSIKADFVANTTLAYWYVLDQTKTFDEQFSSVSPEADIIYIVSMAHYVIERILDTFKAEVEDRINSASICSIPWYHSIILEYQHGHALEFNAKKYAFEYATADVNSRIIKYTAVREIQDMVTKIQIFTNKADHVPLTSDEWDAFKAYVKYRGPAGIHYDFVNENPDRLKFTLQVIFDPLVLKASGQKIIGESYPVRDAIASYIDGITFGGTFNRTKLVDAIQLVAGVIDIILVSVEHAKNSGDFAVVDGQNVVSDSGAFIIESITDTYTPNV